jgi:chemotaxis protein CheX
MSVSREEIEEITRLIWESLLELEITPSGDGALLAELGAVPVGAQVRITGAWEGRVALQCSPALARALTATLFMVDDVEVDDEQQRDAIGELANMIGGNLKACLPQPSKLCLPEALTEGRPAAGAEGSVTFECNGQPVIVLLDQTA